jgi:hypothetical protein
LPEIDAYQYATLDHPARARFRALLLEAAVAARSDPEVRERLRDTINARLDVWAGAHEEWGDERGIDADINMRALLVLLVSADLGLGVLEALGADVPPPDEWAALIRALLGALEGN